MGLVEHADTSLGDGRRDRPSSCGRSANGVETTRWSTCA
jgi:hypothetical protein